MSLISPSKHWLWERALGVGLWERAQGAGLIGGRHSPATLFPRACSQSAYSCCLENVEHSPKSRASPKTIGKAIFTFFKTNWGLREGPNRSHALNEGGLELYKCLIPLHFSLHFSFQKIKVLIVKGQQFW